MESFPSIQVVWSTCEEHTHTHTTLTNAPAGWSRSISSNSRCARLGPTSWTRNAFLLCGESHICVYVTECMKEGMNACVFQVAGSETLISPGIW